MKLDGSQRWAVIAMVYSAFIVGSVVLNLGTTVTTAVTVIGAMLIGIYAVVTSGGEKEKNS